MHERLMASGKRLRKTVHHKSSGLYAVAVILLLTAGALGALAQKGPLRTSVAAGATELPVGPWGSYSLRDLAPCRLTSRKLAPMFRFPIVVGLQQNQILPIGSRTPQGKTRLRPERAATLLRSRGLAPLAGPGSDSLPTAQIREADAAGLLTVTHIAFPAEPPAGSAVSTAIDGEAEAAWFPAYIENEAEGLVVRIAITNRSNRPQTWFADLYAGLDSPNPLFTASDLAVTPAPDGHSVSLKHTRVQDVYTLLARGGDFPDRCQRVAASQFGPAGASGSLDSAGAVRPAEGGEGDSWALARLSGIPLAPGESRTLIFAVGVGADEEASLNSARALQALAEDRVTKAGSLREGLYRIAVAAHNAAKYRSGSAIMDRLMAQSLVDTPFHDLRRVGAPTRAHGGGYQSGEGGWTALGWIDYRPDWAAAQINAWLLTNTAAQKTLDRIVATPPTDILAMWELFQRTHDRDALERFYPFAMWRLRQFIESGRAREGDWLFSWPVAVVMAASSKAPPVAEAAIPVGEAAPDYSAYVLLAARVMNDAAIVLERPQEERDALRTVIDSTGASLKQRLWDEPSGLFGFRPIGADQAVPHAQPGRLAGMLPIAAGPELLTEAQAAALKRRLSEESSLFGRFGLQDAGARGDSGGATVPFGPHWIVWKALLDMGEPQLAQQAASRVLAAYAAAAQASGGCPQRLDAADGAARGAADWSGDSACLIALYAAYHRPGMVSCGWNTYLLDDRYEAAKDVQRIVFRSFLRSAKGALLCVMARPNAQYQLRGGINATLTTDAGGLLTIPLTADPTTQQVEIRPVGTAQ